MGILGPPQIVTLGNNQFAVLGSQPCVSFCTKSEGTTVILNADGGSCSLPTVYLQVLGSWTELKLPGPQIISKGRQCFCPS